MIKINDNNIAIFTDIHWGKGRDNVKKLQISEQFTESFIKQLKSKKINIVFFLGDFFDNRNSINVHTGNTAYKSLKKLCDNFTVYMLVGNHDLYFKNSIEINSLNQFKDIDNLFIIDQTTEVDFNGKSGLLCPWHFNINQYKDKHYDYLFGHFEMNGAALCGSTFEGGEYNMSTLTKISPLVFSGHFHIRKHYNFKNGKVITVGSPFQLDWGDVDNERGYYTLDTQSGDYQFIKNTKSPIHQKIHWSLLKNKSQKILKKDIDGNYIKLVVDAEYQYQDVMKMVEKINSFNPLSCVVDYVFSINRGLLGELKLSKTEFKLTKLQYIVKYIEKMDIQKNLDKNKLIKKARHYYQGCESE